VEQTQMQSIKKL